MVLGIPMTEVISPLFLISSGNPLGPAQGAVPADGEENIDVQLLKGIHNFFDFVLPPGGGKDRPPQLMNIGNLFRGQIDDRMTVLGNKALIPVRDTDHIFNPINIIQFKNNGPDDIIQSRAKPAGSDDGTFDFFGIKINFLPRAGLFKGQGAFPFFKTRPKNIFGNYQPAPDRLR